MDISVLQAQVYPLNVELDGNADIKVFLLLMWDHARWVTILLLVLLNVLFVLLDIIVHSKIINLLNAPKVTLILFKDKLNALSNAQEANSESKTILFYVRQWTKESLTFNLGLDL